mmetsp:Transcript_90073/g.169794  ORF Transcript_90073/g.169794 Transcript_90073/m.169794 type:complete len:321 (+) Transcript_90073:492-1454(+)
MRGMVRLSETASPCPLEAWQPVRPLVAPLGQAAGGRASPDRRPRPCWAMACWAAAFQDRDACDTTLHLRDFRGLLPLHLQLSMGQRTSDREVPSAKVSPAHDTLCQRHIQWQGRYQVVRASCHLCQSRTSTAVLAAPASRWKLPWTGGSQHRRAREPWPVTTRRGSRSEECPSPGGCRRHWSLGRRLRKVPPPHDPAEASLKRVLTEADGISCGEIASYCAMWGRPASAAQSWLHPRRYLWSQCQQRLAIGAPQQRCHTSRSYASGAACPSVRNGKPDTGRGLLLAGKLQAVRSCGPHQPCGAPSHPGMPHKASKHDAGV